MLPSFSRTFALIVPQPSKLMPSSTLIKSATTVSPEIFAGLESYIIVLAMLMVAVAVPVSGPPVPVLPLSFTNNVSVVLALGGVTVSM
jgi:hypothetical protein